MTITDSFPDVKLKAFIEKLRAVDKHSHPNSVATGDSDHEALPLDVLPPFPLPVTLRPGSPNWLAAYGELYNYRHADLSEAHMAELRGTMERVRMEQGAKFPEWVLDRIGSETMLANRVAMGPGLTPPRFRWVSFVDALLLPLSTKVERAVTPDREKLYPFEEKLLRRYLTDLKVGKLPATLDAYVKSVVTPALVRQQQAGCVAVKFQAALLRPLDFVEISTETANGVYSRYLAGGEPSRADYKALQDFLFRYIAREAGRLGMAAHIHSFEGPGAFYRTAEADPLLLESVFNDPTLRATNFVIVHGGGVYASHVGAMLWKPNVYADTFAMALIYTPAALADVLKEWLRQYPEKVLCGTDAEAWGPDTGWELTAWIGMTHVRQALGIALTEMMRHGEVSRASAEEVATMVMRTNAATLYNLKLP